MNIAIVVKKLYNYRMAVELLKKIRENKDLTSYGLQKALQNIGLNISISGVDAYERNDAKRMRLDVLCGLRKISGKTWQEFGKWLDEEFLPK